MKKYIFSSIMSFVVMFGIVFLSLTVKRKLSLIPNNIQLTSESAVSIFYTKLIDTYEDKLLAKKHTALIVSFFLFI